MATAISVSGLVKTFGSTRALDGDPWADAVRLHRRLAYVPGDVSLWPTLSGGETIDLLGRLRGGLDPRRRAELIERFEHPAVPAVALSAGPLLALSAIAVALSAAGLAGFDRRDIR